VKYFIEMSQDGIPLETPVRKNNHDKKSVLRETFFRFALPPVEPLSIEGENGRQPKKEYTA
jgi:hypothetical protein